MERRQAAEQRIVDGSAEYEDIAVYTSINRVFDDQEATLALYGRVKDEGSLDGLTLNSFKNTCFDLLVDAKRYGRIVEEYDAGARYIGSPGRGDFCRPGGPREGCYDARQADHGGLPRALPQTARWLTSAPVLGAMMPRFGA
ncbi:MAG: hypothetical protein OXH09_05555 [Gammaproteobacteria bacterium]|nr:hypothetical protein [Gammaproteobacteria bacterium]